MLSTIKEKKEKRVRFMDSVSHNEKISRTLTPFHYVGKRSRKTMKRQPTCKSKTMKNITL
jgi:hypothetical protein